jgi:hypothetical protein
MPSAADLSRRQKGFYVQIPFRLRAVRRSLVVVAACFLSASAAQGQTKTQMPEPPSKHWGQVQFGALYITPSVALTHIGVDTNVTNSSGEQAADFTFTIQPGVDTVFAGRKLYVKATPFVSAIYYHTFDRYRTLDPGVRLRVEFPVGKTRVFSDDSYIYSYTRPNFEIDERLRRRTGDVGLGVQYPLTPRVDLTVQGRAFRTDYNDASYNGTNVSTTMDERREELRGVVAYDLSNFTNIFSTIWWANDYFPNDRLRDSNTRSIGGGFRFSRRALLRGEVEAGYTLFNLPSGIAENYHGLYTRGMLGFTLTDRTTIDLFTTRQPTYSYSAAAVYYIANYYQATVRRAFGSRLDLSMLFSYQGNNYVGGGQNREITRIYEPSVGYSVGKGLRVGFYASYWDRQSEFNASRDYNNWRFGIRLTTPFVTVNENGGFVNGIQP